MVCVRKPEVRVPVNTGRELIEEPRKTIIRRVTFGEVKIGDGQARRLVHPEADRRCNAIAAILGIRTSGNAALCSHRVEPNGRTARKVIDRLVDIRRDAARGVGAELCIHMHKLVCCWDLALLVDDSASRTSSELHARRPLENLYLVVVKAVAVVASEVTNAVEKYVVARSKPADREIVPLRPALSRSNTYSWHVTNSVCESTILLIMQNKVRDHSHRLRCVQQVLCKFTHRNCRRQLCSDINRVRVLQPDRHVVCILETAVQACVLQQLTEPGVVRIQPLQSGRVEGGKLIRGDRNLNRDTALLP